ncbi:RNA methyltransferase [Hyphodiscus hymeniophilus]|uniref:RNA methyltransferase n=1 Tax=Hyphodiscus hymeniophilus TaxID=353542 RepID=A0A9P6VN64_9HELO|nr:RNA methyltransferase [Hyphodiscus hymeniophilus]
MSVPYQCITRCGESLIAARGSSIDTFDPESGSLISTWEVPSPHGPRLVRSNSEHVSIGSRAQKSESPEVFVDRLSSPAKRRKLVTEDAAKKPTWSKRTSRQEEGLKKSNERSDAIASGLQTPAVILLEATRNGSHVVAVTGEDKTIRVFQYDMDGGIDRLKQLSQRIMPKRPCAIAVTADNSTIISADKFGDVYSLPLLISETEDGSIQPAIPTPAPETSTKPFAPAANALTVHSQRNRKALENQKRQTNRPAEKTERTFEHNLLLGHVSMLTDLALVNLRGRDYILTADRDEHIRVSRGIPQAHIIEGFCLGHTEFVSRLCVPENRPGVLISGGGEEELFVWDWVKGAELSRAGLGELVADVRHKLGGDAVKYATTETVKFAISGITHVSPLENDGFEDLIVVACEGIPAIFVFHLTPENQLQHTQTLMVPGNVLDISKGAVAGFVMLSIDFAHTPGSMTERREPASETIGSLQSFLVQGGQLLSSNINFQCATDVVEGAIISTNMLYGLQNLRKRDGD